MSVNDSGGRPPPDPPDEENNCARGSRVLQEENCHISPVGSVTTMDLNASNNQGYGSASSINNNSNGNVSSGGNMGKSGAINKMKIKINKYSLSDPGPFRVFLESTDDNIKRLHPMKVGKIIFTSLPRYKHLINDISSVGLKKVKIEMNSFEAANNFVMEKSLISYNLSAYIPLFYTTKSGIVRDIPVEISEEELRNDIRCEFPILDIFRFNKKGNKEIKISVIKITFQTQVLPQYIKLHGVRAPVIPFIPTTIICHRCLRYGHKYENCRSTKPRCAFCKDNHETDECMSRGEPECVYCGKGHKTTDIGECSEYAIQKNVKANMITKNMTYKEARAQVEGRPYIEALNKSMPTLDSVNFPLVDYNREPGKRKSAHSDPEEAPGSQSVYSLTGSSKRKRVQVGKERNYPPLPQATVLNARPISSNPYRNSPFSKNLESQESLFKESIFQFVLELIGENIDRENINKEEIMLKISNKFNFSPAT